MQVPSRLKNVAVAVALATGGAVLATGLPPAAMALDAAPAARVEMTVPDFSALVQQNAASVVNVSVAGKRAPVTMWPGMPDLSLIHI